MTQAHNARGFARFFLGQYEAAAKDFQESSEWKGDDVYTLLWRYIVQARTGGEAANNLERWAKDKDFAEWPGQLIYVYRGKLSPQEALRAADDPSPKRQREKKCEAYFYLGELLLTQGKKTEAIKMFRAAVATNVTGFVEYEAAKAELKRLGA